MRVAGAPATSIPLSTVAVLSNPLRYAFDASAAAATQFAGGGSPDRPPSRPTTSRGWRPRDYYSPIRSTFASGMHAAVVETDPETAEIRVLRYCVVHDCGTLVNPMIVEGQIHGGVAQGVGGALYEKVEYDENGQILNASFMDFLMPYATEVPKIETDHLETPSPLNPLGIKGAGEAGVIPGMAVFAAAIEDAEGFPITEDADLAVGAVRAPARARAALIRPTCGTRPGRPRPRPRRTVARQGGEGPLPTLCGELRSEAAERLVVAHIRVHRKAPGRTLAHSGGSWDRRRAGRRSRGSHRRRAPRGARSGLYCLATCPRRPE